MDVRCPVTCNFSQRAFVLLGALDIWRDLREQWPLQPATGCQLVSDDCKTAANIGRAASTSSALDN